MSTDEDLYAQEVFENRRDQKACVFCAGIHDRVAGLMDYFQPCPRVKKLERDSVGNLTSVEFWPNGHWESRVVFPSDVYQAEDTDE